MTEHTNADGRWKERHWSELEAGDRVRVEGSDKTFTGHVEFGECPLTGDRIEFHWDSGGMMEKSIGTLKGQDHSQHYDVWVEIEDDEGEGGDEDREVATDGGTSVDDVEDVETVDLGAWSDSDIAALVAREFDEQRDGRDFKHDHGTTITATVHPERIEQAELFQGGVLSIKSVTVNTPAPDTVAPKAEDGATVIEFDVDVTAVRERHRDSEDDWQAVARHLHECGGVPSRRAEVVALVDSGRSHSETADRLGIERQNVSTHVRRYREERADAEWLVEHGPQI